MNPELTPASRVRNGGKPLIQIRMHEPVDAALGNRREIGQRDGEEVERHRHRLPVKIAAAEQIAVVEHERIVGRRVQLSPDDARGELDRVEHRAVHLRHAAQRVRVLHARIVVAMRLANLAVGQQLAEICRGRGLPELAARRPECARRTRPACRAAPRATSRRRRARCARGDARRRARAQPIAVCACVPLMSVSPSLRAERRRREARALRSMSAARSGADRRDDSVPSPISESARCANGARSPLAPTLPCSGTGGQSPALSMPASKSARSSRAPEIALGDHVRAQQHHRADFALREQVADARRMAAHEIHLQLGEAVRRNRDLRQLAESGRHAVRDGTACHEVDRRPRASSPRAGGRAEPSSRARDRARPR